MNYSGASTSHVAPSGSGNGGGQKRSKKNQPQDLAELVGNSPNQRNWRGILIALLVILIVCALIVVAVILVMPPTKTRFIGEPFTFEDMFNPEFKPAHFSASWVGESDTFVYRTREGELMEYNARSNTSNLIIDNSTFRQFNANSYFVSEDLDYVLLAYDIEQVYRHSFKARYVIVKRHPESEDQRIIEFPSDKQYQGKLLQFAGWSTTGHKLTFVYENNLYYQESPKGKVKSLTNIKEKGKIAGIPDWVYEEEILESNKAHWWSLDSRYLCYAEFDDRNVPPYKFPYYGDPDSIYGHIDEVPYPKAGDINDGVIPKVKLLVFEASEPESARRELEPPAEFKNRDHYVTGVYWQDMSNVMVTWLNRPQNKSIIMICEAHTGLCHLNWAESKSGPGWLSLGPPIFITVDRKPNYVIVLSQQDGSQGYWKHIARITAEPGPGNKHFLTEGTWEVLGLAGYDKKNSDIYFYANGGDLRAKHLYKVRIPDDYRQKMTRECVTCSMPKDQCSYVDAKFSSSGEYYILSCLGPDPPVYMLKNVADNETIIFEDNVLLKGKLAKKALPVRRFMEIDSGLGHTIMAEVSLPRTLVKQHIVRYPLLVHTYAGPATQRVTFKFRIGWETYLTSKEHIICVSFDGRGTIGRGDSFLHQIYGKLGTMEVEDQILGARNLTRQLHYVDNNRTAIWGWSYGGFVTSHAVANNSNMFSCGIAVAPVTDWRYYDAVYTERYMGLVTENYRGYDRANVSGKADFFRNKNFLLVHGTADDNVHFQHTAQLVKALTEADVDFRIQMYTDKNHALSGPKTSRHLYRTMTHFLQHECWDGGKPRTSDPAKDEEQEKGKS